MYVIRTFFVVFLFHSALSEDALVQPCSKNDIACLNHAAQSFLEKTSAGLPQYDLLPIDPMEIPHVDTTLESGDKVYLKNVRVTKIKSLTIHDFKIDASKKSVVFSMHNDPDIVADIEIESKDGKQSGTFSSKGRVIPTAKYNYDLVPNKDGVEYFTVGPEAITCELEGSPEITLDNGLDKVLYKDGANTEEIKKQIVCSIVTPAFNKIIHNLRQSAKFYPKTYYFTDL